MGYQVLVTARAGLGDLCWQSGASEHDVVGGIVCFLRPVHDVDHLKRALTLVCVISVRDAFNFTIRTNAQAGQSAVSALCTQVNCADSAQCYHARVRSGS